MGKVNEMKSYQIKRRNRERRPAQNRVCIMDVRSIICHAFSILKKQVAMITRKAFVAGTHADHMPVLRAF